MSFHSSMRRSWTWSKLPTHLSTCRNQPTTLISINFQPFYNGILLIKLECMYLVKYPEETHRGGPDPWSVRQTALYHQIRLRDRRSAFVLVSPMMNSVGQNAIIAWLHAKISASDCRSEAFTVNTLLTASYIDGFRDYMNFYERRIGDLVSTANDAQEK